MFMRFNENDEPSKQDRVNQLWNQIADMIIGPDHEYAYLKKIVARCKFQYIMD